MTKIIKIESCGKCYKSRYAPFENMTFCIDPKGPKGRLKPSEIHPDCPLEDYHEQKPIFNVENGKIIGGAIIVDDLEINQDQELPDGHYPEENILLEDEW